VARKYVRDNRGRFASTGTGATARGGRLRTAAGNKRATQTIQAGSRAGVMRKPPPANNAPMTRKDRQSINDVRRAKAGKPNAEDRMIADAMRRRGVNANLGQPKAADQPGRIQNVPGKDLKRYRMLQGAKIRQQKISAEAGARMGYTGTRPGQQEKLYAKSDLAWRRAQRADATQRKLSGATGKGEAPKPVPNWHLGEKDKFRGGVGYLKRRGASSLSSEGQIGRVKVDRYGAQRPGVIRKPKAAPQATQSTSLPSGRTVFRSRGEAARAQRARSANMLDAGNARANTREGGVSVLTSGGYGVRRKFGNVEDRMLMSRRTELKQPGAKETFIPVRAGAGARIRGRTTATQPSLLGGPAKVLKVFRKAPRAKGRR
jgi:hypothetical protein